MVDMKKVLVGLLLLVIFIILVFQFLGSSATDLRDAADSVTDANNCSLHSQEGEIGIYNFTDKVCYNGTSGGQALYTAKQFDLPLSTLFGRSGVLLLIFMSVMLIMVVVTVMKGIKDKKQ